ncbi:hypothetical protein [Nitratireductor sp. XY-223]|uniref:hypothetical protein n=1 Tax=Nitratireductor sp. XY-223 TaxID=2561926 RepID=UPI00145B2C05|nr:hypothetical protein [Nitratireductor sp. XY-223]
MTIRQTWGTEGDDTLPWGNPNGLPGVDHITGRGGGDTIHGGDGNDRIWGGDGGSCASFRSPASALPPPLVIRKISCMRKK